MKLKLVSLVLLLSLLVLPACRGNTEPPVEAVVLSAEQVNSSQIGQVVKVRAKILWLVENPGGLGGLYARLGTEDTKVAVRIQEHVWTTYSEKEKAQFKNGNVVIVEGELAPAGGQLVVVVGRSPP